MVLRFGMCIAVLLGLCLTGCSSESLPSVPPPPPEGSVKPAPPAGVLPEAAKKKLNRGNAKAANLNTGSPEN
jgi:hypothetical protein